MTMKQHFTKLNKKKFARYQRMKQSHLYTENNRHQEPIDKGIECDERVSVKEWGENQVTPITTQASHINDMI